MKLAIIFALALLAGCGKSPDSSSKVRRSTGWGTEVQLHTLPDGTRCAVLMGPEGRGGIDCDWKRGVE